MLDERLIDRAQLLDPLLRVVYLALEHHQRPGKVLDHLRFPLLELLLPAAQFLELALLLFDMLLLALELDQLLLRLLHLVVQALDGFVLIEV